MGRNKDYRFMSFDIEVGKFDINKPLEKQLPLGITCAAVAWRTPLTGMMYHTWESGKGKFTMTKSECQKMVFEISKMIVDYHIDYLVTVNGIGFDFPVLAADSGLAKEVALLAIDSVDFLYHMVCARGFRVSLDALAKGLGVEGKLHNVMLSDGTLIRNMQGGLAPQLWQDNERAAVLAYLKEDVRVTIEVAEKIASSGAIQWITKKGRSDFVSTKIMTVKECQKHYPHVDNSWMTNPPDRDQMLGWIRNAW